MWVRRTHTVNGLKAKTRNNELSALRGVLDLAVEYKLLPENPTIKIRNLKEQKPIPDPLTKEEVLKLLSHMEKQTPAPVYNYFKFMFSTGCRPEEAIAVRWSDLEAHTKHPILVIQRARSAGEEKQTKTNTAREISLSHAAVSAIEAQRPLSIALDCPYIFFNPNTSRPWSSEKFQRTLYWYPALFACGIRKRVPYQTRHTFASVALSAGAQPLWLARQLGHATPKMVFERYARWMPTEQNSTEHLKIDALFKL